MPQLTLAIITVLKIGFAYQLNMRRWICQCKVHNNIDSENENGHYETVEFKFSLTQDAMNGIKQTECQKWKKYEFKNIYFKQDLLWIPDLYVSMPFSLSVQRHVAHCENVPELMSNKIAKT